LVPENGRSDGPTPHQNNPAKKPHTQKSMEDKNSSPPADPPIYKHLNAKTQGLLRQSNRVLQEQKQAEIMSNEQT